MWQIKHAQKITAGVIAYADVSRCPTPFFQNHILVSANARSQPYNAVFFMCVYMRLYKRETNPLKEGPKKRQN